MATIQFENGVKVNFEGTPTPQDVEEVAQKLNIRKQQNQSVAPLADKQGTPANPFGQNQSYPLKGAASFIGKDVFGGGVGKSELTPMTDLSSGVRRFGQEAFQTTLGSKSLAGVAQMPGKALSMPFNLATERQLSESIGSAADQATALLRRARTETDPVKKQRMNIMARDLFNGTQDLAQHRQGLEDQDLTYGKILGTTGNAALTASTFGLPGMAPSAGATAAMNPARTLATKGIVAADLPYGAAAKTIGATARILDNVALGVTFNAMNNLIEGRPVAEGGKGVAVVSTAIPIGGTITRKVVSESGNTLLRSAERLYQSAMKPSLSRENLPKIPGIIRTGLDEAIILSQGGVEKVASRIDTMEEQLGNAIEEAGKKNGMVPVNALKGYVEEAKLWFSHISDIEYRKKAVKDIDAVFKNFKKQYGNAVPVEEAQKIKVATYRWLKDAYGELASPIKEANKQLVRGLKEGIVDVAPMAGNINARLKKLYAFDEQLSKSTGRIKNLNLLGLGTKVLATTGGKVGAIMAVFNQLLGAPGKSAAAITLDRLGKMLNALDPLQRTEMFINNPSLKVLYEKVTGVRPQGGRALEELPVGLRIQDIASRIHPEDRSLMAKFIDHVRTGTAMSETEFTGIERLLQRFGFKDRGLNNTANLFDNILSGGKEIPKGTGTALIGSVPAN